MKINIKKFIAEELQKFLDAGKQILDSGENELLLNETASFGAGIEADIKVYNSDSGPWIDAILFDNGEEACLLEPRYELLGEYLFCHNNKEYCVEVTL